MKALFNREPAAVLAAVQSALALMLAFGVRLSTEQVGTIVAVTSAVLGLIVRSQVTPTKKEA
jgi:hypothetical protein